MCKQRQHCLQTTPNNVGCYMLQPFAYPVACCCCAKFETGQTFSPVQTDTVLHVKKSKVKTLFTPFMDM